MSVDASALLMIAQERTENRAKLETLDQLIENTLPGFLCPVPPKETLRYWFDKAQVPRFKSNPSASRGGGHCYYDVAAVERFLRERIVAG